MNKALRFCVIGFLLMTMNIYGVDVHELNKKQKENSKTVVDLLGALRVKENQIVDKTDTPVALHGMSMFWSQWSGKFYNEKCIDWLYKDFHCTVIRAAMGVDGGGYLVNQETELEKVFTVVEKCINLGIYVIVDWHDHRAENHLEQAKAFFNLISEKYGDKPNIIYEIYNEPLKVSWSEVIKPYAEEVIKAIRKNDPDNLIIVGTSTWSQDVDEASKDMIEDKNTAYAIHFYTSTHKQYLRDKAVEAMKNGAALFVSEYGTSEANGNGIIDSLETESWMKFVKENNLSTCIWSVSDKDETSAALLPGASAEGGWKESELSVSGRLNREYIRKENDSLLRKIGMLK